MARSFTSQDMIQLPRLNAAEAVALITELLGAAKAVREHSPLPPRIERGLGRLEESQRALSEALLPKASGTDPSAQRKADLEIDAAWSATFDWLSGWCKLGGEENPHRTLAKALFNLLFPDALAFTRLPFKMEWAESQARLEAIQRDGHDKLFKLLGGAPFLIRLRKAQQAYGEALNMTPGRPREPASPELRLRMDAALDALREYVVQSASLADPDAPGSEGLSESLLKPFSDWDRAPAH